MFHNNQFSNSHHSTSDHSIRIIQVPPTTDTCIVFPSHEPNETFDRNFYSPLLTERRASVEDINNMPTQFEAIIREARTENRICSGLSFLFTIGGFAVTALLMFSIFSSDPSSSKMFVAPIVLMLLVAVFAILVTKCGKATVENARINCQQIINRNNQFKAVGLRWNLPMNFPHWVELWRDYRGAPGHHQNFQIGPNYPHPQYPNSYPQHAGFYAPPPPAGSFIQDP